MVRRHLSVFAVIIIISAAIYGGIKIFTDNPSNIIVEGNDPDIPTINLYTSGQATTPQLALFAAIREGDLKGLFNIRIHLWKNPDDLLSLVLAGKGDMWVGHTDGFSTAWLRKAPVQMLTFNSFNKFFIVSSEASHWKDMNGRTAAYAPAGSPAVGLIKTVSDRSGIKLNLVPYQGRELELLVLSGKIKTAIIPEPLVSIILSKNSSMKVIGNVEDMFCRITGNKHRVPVAGIAVNSRTAAKYSDRFALLQQVILKRTALLQASGKKAAEYFPSYFEKYIPVSLVELSLERETINAGSASDLREDLFLYLKTVQPDLFNMEDPAGLETFLWKP